MVRSRVLVVVSAAGAIAVAAVVAAVFAVNSGHRASGRPAGHPSAGVPAADQGPRVAAALRRLATDPQSLVATQAQGLVNGHSGQAVPAGSTVTPDEQSWAPDGTGGGAMLVTVTTPDGRAVTYQAVMLNEAGQWKVLATFAVPGTR